jgi:hypothetical protein
MRVALKALNPHAWPGERAADQLYRELRFGRSMEHPNVCRIHDVFQAGARGFLVMDLASAGTLRSTLTARGADRPAEEKMADARSAAAGLTAIHGAGLVHRDLKPENLLRMTDGRLVLSDFGLARPLDQTGATGLAGTPGYLAPEALSGTRPAPAADVWSLGVVLHEILAGRRPEWPAHRAPSPLAGRTTNRIEGAIARARDACLRIDPDRRPTAEEVKRLLDPDALRLPGRSGRGLGWLAIAVLGATAALLLSRSIHLPRPAPTRAPSAAADWSRSRLLLTRGGRVCMDLLVPARRVVRVTTQEPRLAMDIDVSTGRWAPGPPPPEGDCPAYARDGNAVLFSRTLRGRPRLLVANRPDGAGAREVGDGSLARWLPSGDRFIYASPEGNLMMGSERRANLLRTPRGPRAVHDLAIDRVARLAVVISADPDGGASWIDLYEVEPWLHVRSWREQQPQGPPWITFDPLREVFLLSQALGQHDVASEITEDGELRVVGWMPGRNIGRALRSAGGLVFSTETDPAQSRVLPLLGHTEIRLVPVDPGR